VSGRGDQCGATESAARAAGLSVLLIVRSEGTLRAQWLSDIIESVFGHYKTFTTRGPLKEVGRLVLLIPAFLLELSAAVIDDAMTSVRSIEVEQWIENNLGPSMLARRRRAFAGDIEIA